MKKVVLINTHEEESVASLDSHLPSRIPVGPHFPLGIACVASYLKEKLPQISLSILDEQLLDLKKIERRISRIRPDIVGINCMFKNYKRVLELARVSKKIGAKVVMGGTYATALAREILINRGPQSSDYCIDVIIKQDGERAFYQYVKGDLIKNINNLVYWHNGEVIENNIKLLQLDNLPSLRLDIITPEIYFKEYQRKFSNSKYKKPFVIYSQKGCYWRSKPKGGCIFCSLMYKELRLRNPKNVWHEIDRLVSDYSVDYIWDVSDSLLSDKNWFKEFYHQSQKRSNKPFFKIQARTDDLIDESIVRMISKMNVAQIFVGFESADNRCLTQIKKGTTSQINKKAISLLSKYRLPIRAYFVLGVPGDSKQSLEKTTKLAEKILDTGRNNLIVSPLFTPLPGSPAYQLLKQKTGEKYAGKDIINWNEAIRDWIDCFCKVPYDEVKKTQKHLRQFPYDITSYSY